MAEVKKPPQPQAGDLVYSEFFKHYLTIIEITSDDEWYFELQDRQHRSQTPLSYFNKFRAVGLWQHD